MNGRNDIIGYTLAEIALLLLFAIIAIFLPKYSTLSAHLRAQTASRLLLEKEVAALKEQLALVKPPGASPAGLRSRQMPSCIERKLASGPIFSAVALSNGKYRVGGEELTASEIRSRFAEQIADADKHECRQRIQLGYSTGMSAEQFVQAQVQMENWFYVSKIVHY